eukprot:6194310-Pleurochrysis_carterae.AAC.6
MHDERIARAAHQPLRDGKLASCDCCTFARHPDTSQVELRDFLQKLTALHAASPAEEGKKAFSTFVPAHKQVHKGAPHLVLIALPSRLTHPCCGGWSICYTWT